MRRSRTPGRVTRSVTRAKKKKKMETSLFLFKIEVPFFDTPPRCLGVLVEPSEATCQYTGIACSSCSAQRHVRTASETVLGDCNNWGQIGNSGGDDIGRSRASLQRHRGNQEKRLPFFAVGSKYSFMIPDAPQDNIDGRTAGCRNRWH